MGSFFPAASASDRFFPYNYDRFIDAKAAHRVKWAFNVD